MNSKTPESCNSKKTVQAILACQLLKEHGWNVVENRKPQKQPSPDSAHISKTNISTPQPNISTSDTSNLLPSTQVTIESVVTPSPSILSIFPTSSSSSQLATTTLNIKTSPSIDSNKSKPVTKETKLTNPFIESDDNVAKIKSIDINAIATNEINVGLLKKTDQELGTNLNEQISNSYSRPLINPSTSGKLKRCLSNVELNVDLLLSIQQSMYTLTNEDVHNEVIELYKHSFMLPDFNNFSMEFREFLHKELIETSTLVSLEQAGRLNWWHDKKICQRLLPLATTGDGNCLLHAVSLGMWGFHDRKLTLRKALYDIMTKDNYVESFRRRWRYNQEQVNQQLGLMYSEKEWMDEWENLVKLASPEPRSINNIQKSTVTSSSSAASAAAIPQTNITTSPDNTTSTINNPPPPPTTTTTSTTTATITTTTISTSTTMSSSATTTSTSIPNDTFYESLEEIHIFALCHVLRRPIFVVADTILHDSNGEALAPISFGGVYLPLEISPVNCNRSPLILSYDSAHFSAILPLNSEFRVQEDEVIRVGLDGSDGGGAGGGSGINNDSSGDDDDSGLIAAIPLVDSCSHMLPIHFLVDPIKENGCNINNNTTNINNNNNINSNNNIKNSINIDNNINNNSNNINNQGNNIGNIFSGNTNNTSIDHNDHEYRLNVLRSYLDIKMLSTVKPSNTTNNPSLNNNNNFINNNNVNSCYFALRIKSGSCNNITDITPSNGNHNNNNDSNNVIINDINSNITSLYKNANMDNVTKSGSKGNLNNDDDNQIANIRDITTGDNKKPHSSSLSSSPSSTLSTKNKGKFPNMAHQIVRTFNSLGRSMRRKVRQSSSSPFKKSSNSTNKTTNIIVSNNTKSPQLQQNVAVNKGGDNINDINPTTTDAKTSTTTSVAMTTTVANDNNINIGVPGTFLCAAITENLQSYQREIIQNYLDDAYQRYQSNKINRQEILADLESLVAMECVNDGCDGLGNAQTSYLCFECFERHTKEEMELENSNNNNNNNNNNNSTNSFKNSLRNLKFNIPQIMRFDNSNSNNNSSSSTASITTTSNTINTVTATSYCGSSINSNNASGSNVTNNILNIMQRGNCEQELVWRERPIKVSVMTSPGVTRSSSSSSKPLPPPSSSSSSSSSKPLPTSSSSSSSKPPMSSSSSSPQIKKSSTRSFITVESLKRVESGPRLPMLSSSLPSSSPSSSSLPPTFHPTSSSSSSFNKVAADSSKQLRSRTMSGVQTSSSSLSSSPSMKEKGCLDYNVWFYKQQQQQQKHQQQHYQQQLQQHQQQQYQQQQQLPQYQQQQYQQQQQLPQHHLMDVEQPYLSQLKQNSQQLLSSPRQQKLSIQHFNSVQDPSLRQQQQHQQQGKYFYNNSNNSSSNSMKHFEEDLENELYGFYKTNQLNNNINITTATNNSVDNSNINNVNNNNFSNNNNNSNESNMSNSTNYSTPNKSTAPIPIDSTLVSGKTVKTNHNNNIVPRSSSRYNGSRGSSYINSGVGGISSGYLGGGGGGGNNINNFDFYQI